MKQLDEQELVAVAIEAAALAGVAAVDPGVLYAGSSVIIALGPEGPVARAGGTTAVVRDLDAHYMRDTVLASWLSDAGAPVVRPWDPSGPFIIRGRVVSLWTRAVTTPPADPSQAGRALRRCHQALRTFSGPLPSVVGLIEEARRIAAGAELDESDRNTLHRAFAYADEVLNGHGLPEQALHGDAGMGNVLTGGIWHDWEDACRGPLVWDLASLVSTARITGRTPARAEAMLQAYGNAPGLDQLDHFVAVRGIQVLAWSLLGSAHDGQLHPSTITRLRWVREHNWAV